MHHIWRESPWEEVWQAFELLVQQGKVLYVGSSNFAGWHIAKANEAARRRNFLGLVSEQSIYHLDNRAVERDLLPACEDYGLGVIPWSPLGGGKLAGVLSGVEADSRRSGLKLTDADRAKLEKWEALCQRLGEKPADVAIAWLLHQKAVTAPIIGPRTLAQLDGSLRALEIKLSAETLASIDEIFPGNKPSPEGYACERFEAVNEWKLAVKWRGMAAGVFDLSLPARRYSSL